jgi:uncharacterized protein (TIGR02246 family)
MVVRTHDTAVSVEDRLAIEAYLEALAAAWGRGDARAYAALFTPGATYVIFAGVASTGRQAIEDTHRPLFEKWQRGTRMSVRVLEMQMVALDVVSVLTEGGIGKGANLPCDKMQTFTLVRTAEGWQCAAFQNTKKNRLFIWMSQRASR